MNDLKNDGMKRISAGHFGNDQMNYLREFDMCIVIVFIRIYVLRQDSFLRLIYEDSKRVHSKECITIK